MENYPVSLSLSLACCKIFDEKGMRKREKDEKTAGGGGRGVDEGETMEANETVEIQRENVGAVYVYGRVLADL